ncbi:MAG: antibiotic biosynthesis monooxygenase [Spirochaetaceae bacterium]|nr:antibiotic biosynthesis monooxygenase [Spirochaetaceae bacterium]
MLKIIAKCNVSEEDSAKFIQNATQLVNITRKEKGCISYELFHDLENKDIYYFIEEWKDVDAAKVHGSSDYFKAAISTIASTLSTPIEINKLQKAL